MLTAVLVLLGLVAGAAHGGFEAMLAGLGGLVAGLLLSAREQARARDIDDRLRQLDDKTRWLYEALKSRAAAPATAAGETDVPAPAHGAASDPSAGAPPAQVPTPPPAAAPHSAHATPLEALHGEGLRVQAPPRPTARADDDLTQPVMALWSRLMGGNPLARIGVIVLFFGVASALRLAAQAGWLPPELRLAAATATGVAMILSGLRLPGNGPRRMFALAIQGGGFALLYLAVYFALARYGFIGAGPAFGLFAVLGLACAVTAARQSSQVLALLGLSGAFVAPMLASSGQGQYIVLFSYYLLLDAFIIALSWRRAWRALTFAGFLFTFAVGAGWGLRSYVTDDYLAVQGFLIAFFLLFTATHVAQTVLRAPGAAGWQSGSLLFGPPLAAGVLQAALVQPYEYGAAISAALAGLYYLGLAGLLRARAPDEALTFRAHAGIGAALLTLAVPLAFDLQMTAAIYAVEGAAALWYGCARRARLTLWAGAALQVAAGVWLIAALDTLGVARPLLNGRTLGCLLLAGAAFTSVRVLRQTAAGADWLPRALTFWLAGWWLAGGLADIDDFVPIDLQPALALLFAIASAAFAEQQGRTRHFMTARALAALSLPVLWAGSLFAWDQHAHLLYGSMALVLPLAWATHLWVLRRQDEDGAALLNTPRHLATAWTLLLSVGVEAGGWLGDWLPAQDLWRWLAWIAVWLAAGHTVRSALTRGETDRWPWMVAPDIYARALLWPVASLLLLTVVALQFGHDGASALPYLPLASALDLTSVAALLWLARSHLLPLPLVGGACLLWVSALAARSVHHVAGVAWSAVAMFQSTLLQAALSLTWTVAALALMVYATRRGARTLWFAGFALLAAVGVKMLMIDLAGAGTVEWTASLLGIGALILIASYVAPVPPGTAPEHEDTR